MLQGSNLIDVRRQVIPEEERQAVLLFDVKRPPYIWDSDGLKHCLVLASSVQLAQFKPEVPFAPDESDCDPRPNVVRRPMSR
jgi:hypothetical protein